MENTFSEYRKAYKLHLINNNLEDDSNMLSDVDIFNYLINHVDSEDREWYGLKPIRYCKLRDCEDITNLTGTDIEIKGLCLPYKGSSDAFRIIFNDYEHEEFSTAFDFFIS